MFYKKSVKVSYVKLKKLRKANRGRGGRGQKDAGRISIRRSGDIDHGLGQIAYCRI